MKKKSLSPKELKKSLGHAWEGLNDMLKTEHMAWLHAGMTLLVLAVCWWIQLDLAKFCFILIAIAAVWVVECFNTVIEIITDHVSPQYSPTAKRAKDISAGAVLIACIGAALIGLIILGPPVAEKLGFLLK